MLTRASGGRSALAYLSDGGGAEATDAIVLDFALLDMTGGELLAEHAAQPSLGNLLDHARFEVAREEASCIIFNSLVIEIGFDT